MEERAPVTSSSRVNQVSQSESPTRELLLCSHRVLTFWRKVRARYRELEVRVRVRIHPASAFKLLALDSDTLRSLRAQGFFRMASTCPRSNQAWLRTSIADVLDHNRTIEVTQFLMYQPPEMISKTGRIFRVKIWGFSTLDLVQSWTWDHITKRRRTTTPSCKALRSNLVGIKRRIIVMMMLNLPNI